MKRLILSISLCATLTAILSCSGDDLGNADIHDPSSFFEPSADATDPTSSMRREFQQKYGSFLLFNDTIQKVFKGFDLNGDSVFWTEVLALDYTVPQVAYASNAYTYTYLKTMEEKRKAVDFMETRILPHLGAKMRPYSWLLCSQITYVYSNTVQKPYAASGQRAIAVSTGMLSRLKNEAQIQQLISRIMLVILNNLVSKNTAAFSEFASVSSKCYGKSLTVPAGDNAQNIARSKGFLDKTTNTWGATIYPDLASDLSQYCTYAISRDDAYMETNFASYPLVIKKWYLFKQTLTTLGYVFDIN